MLERLTKMKYKLRIKSIFTLTWVRLSLKYYCFINYFTLISRLNNNGNIV